MLFLNDNRYYVDQPACRIFFYVDAPVIGVPVKITQCVVFPQWLRALPSTRQTLRTVFGECPYCSTVRMHCHQFWPMLPQSSKVLFTAVFTQLCGSVKLSLFPL